MENRTFLIGAMVSIGLFVYLIASFLVATFNIALWHDYYRFFTVIIYLFLLVTFIQAWGKNGESKVHEENNKYDSVTNK